MKIMIVEDSETQRLRLKLLLEKEKFEVFISTNGKDALSKIDSVNPDLLISDIIMPEMDGYEFCKALRQNINYKNLPVILLTQLSEAEDIVKGLKCGANYFITKPYTNENLLKYVYVSQKIQKIRENRIENSEHVKIILNGKEHVITAEKSQILDLLISIYDAAIQKNNELNTAHLERMELVSSNERVFTELNDTLEKRVLERTSELARANLQLKNEILEREKIEKKAVTLNNQLMTAARRAGMSDIITSVLHNIGNVLNSINTSATMIDQKISQSELIDFIKISDLLKKHEKDMNDFLVKNSQGKHIPQFIIQLADKWQDDQAYLKKEVNELKKNITHVKEIIIKQESLTGVLGISEEIMISQLLEDALLLNKPDFEQGKIDVVKHFTFKKKITVDRVKLLQILVNLIKNSIDSLLVSKNKNKKLTLSVKKHDDNHCLIEVNDNGSGISPDNLSKIFTYGFTTKKTGHGFGLHSSILAAQEMNSQLSVKSDGLGKGATFSLILPHHFIASEQTK